MKLVDAAELAQVLGVSRAFVYEHSAEFAVVRLGSGPKARLRFDVEKALESLGSCTTSRRPEQPEPPQPSRSRSRRSRALDTSVELVPIRRSRMAA